VRESLCEESVSLPTFHIPNHPIAMSATTTELSANSLTTTCLRCSLWLVTWKLAFSSCVALMPTREPRGDESAMNLRGGTALHEAYSPKCSEGRFSEVELPIYGVLRSPLWVELLLYERLCCLSCVYRVCVPMHYLPLTVFGSKDPRGPKDPRGDFLASADLGFASLYLHYVGELGSRVFSLGSPR
jgi:hypothetical protein